ncbi:MAG: hypothetical protein WBH40_15535 [Ignavibacteriaceae bacterium]|jgi:hypothetical protein
MRRKIIFKASFVLMLFLVLFLALSFTAPGPISNWELVYENNSYGSKISGDIDELISAVMSGSDIKVMLHFDSADLHYQMQLSKVKVDLCNRIVSGYNFDFRQNPTDKNVYSRISTYNTNGQYTSIYEVNPDYRSPEVIRVSMSWFVCNR